jgi:hypothetical protein
MSHLCSKFSGARIGESTRSLEASAFVCFSFTYDCSSQFEIGCSTSMSFLNQHGSVS